MKGNFRAPWHDYKRKGLYHITLLKHPDAPAFGVLAGDFRVPAGTLGSPYIVASETGRAVKEAMRELPCIHPSLKLHQYALMPDHLHMLLGVLQDMDEALGLKIAAFKLLVNRKVGNGSVFERGFNDNIIISPPTLNNVFAYLRANAYRLAVRRAFPNFFERHAKLTIAQTECQAYGNIHLLDNPFKEQVIVHRADSDEAFIQKKEHWMHTAANGGVLVSPFISKREKEVRAEAEAMGSRIILITNRPFAEREKPGGHDFDLCVQGRLLIIAPQTPIDFSRAACLKMNTLAEAIIQPC